jgi:hypothetical protein
MKTLYSLFLLLPFLVCSQTATTSSERYPVFNECESEALSNLENCFDNTLKSFIYSNFIVPETIDDDLNTDITVIFEVDTQGVFNVIYTEAVFEELQEATLTVFEKLPKIEPASYNSRAIDMQFRMPIKLPLSRMLNPTREEDDKSIIAVESVSGTSVKNEYDTIKVSPYKNIQASSQINIPLSHEVYSRFDDDMNQVGTNNHTASKPLLYKEVQRYYDFEKENKKLHYDKSSWFGRKFFNEHLIRLQGEDYWFTLDVAADLQLGKDLDRDLTTYNNTRAAVFQGGLGKNLNFHTVLYESQGRFAGYYNDYSRSLKPDGGNPAIIPGRGIAKEFGDDAFDYPIATGYLSYSPSKFFNVQFGHGKNFIGDGYRSLLLSDNASPYPYFKLNTTFWKLKYTNTWMSLRDVRPAVTADGSFRTKYMANHYLSINVSKRLNIGLFENVIWENDNDRGFDLNYLNPVIFYRAIEFSTGSRGGNAIIGLTGKYKWSDSFNTYAQLLIDEFSSGDITGGEGSYKNKIGYQLGFKYFNAFKVPNLIVQGEYNQVRPYTYSHNSITLNYGHNNQSQAHLWGANFREFIGILRYKYKRYYGLGKLIYGERGFDFKDGIAYGGNIFTSEDDRPADNSNNLLQGNKATSFYGELELGYIINPATNFKVYATAIYRDFSVNEDVSDVVKTQNTVWLNFGVRTDLFNWYYDY